MEVSWNGGTPSHHPFLDGFFPNKNQPIKGVPPLMETPDVKHNNNHPIHHIADRESTSLGEVYRLHMVATHEIRVTIRMLSIHNKDKYG